MKLKGKCVRCFALIGFVTMKLPKRKGDTSIHTAYDVYCMD